MLLLHDQGTSAAPSREEMQERIREYSNWAHATASRGLIGGDKLADEGVLLSSAPSGVLSRALPGEGDVLGGYFLLDDMDESAALEIARGCPQLRHGGVVELRRIEP
jgi:hypothetical protein